MGINRSSALSIVEYLRVANGLAVADLSPDDLTFGIPAPVAGTWREGLTAHNTAVRITATDASVYTGTTVVTYDRLQLGDLNNLLTSFQVKAYNPANVHDILHVIRLKYGIILDAADIVNDPVTPVVDAPYQVTLTAAPNALGWLGSATVTVEQGNAILGDYLTVSNLPGLNYPVAGDGSSGSALMYLYPYDFTAYKSTLEAYVENQVIGAGDTALLDAIKAVDLGTGAALWNLDPAQTTWSLDGATVVYSGINSNLLPTNQSYKYVLGIALRGDVTTPPGTFYLHYNDPFDPNAL